MTDVTDDDQFQCWAPPREMECHGLFPLHGRMVCDEVPFAVCFHRVQGITRPIAVCPAHLAYLVHSAGDPDDVSLSTVWDGARWVPPTDARVEHATRAQLSAGTVELPSCEHDCRDHVLTRYGMMPRVPDPAAVRDVRQRQAARRDRYDAIDRRLAAEGRREALRELLHLGLGTAWFITTGALLYVVGNSFTRLVGDEGTCATRGAPVGAFVLWGLGIAVGVLGVWTTMRRAPRGSMARGLMLLDLLVRVAGPAAFLAIDVARCGAWALDTVLAAT